MEGRVGDGTLGVAGRVNYAERGKAAWEILLRGEGLRIYEDDKLRLQAKADVEARGLGEEGEVKGSLDLRGSAVLRGILLTPLLGAAVESAPVTAPMVWDLAPFASWKINVQLGAEELLPVGRGERAGALGLELSLQGILGEPLLLGTLRAEKLAVEFPARGRMTAGGRVHFTKEKPWMPVLDLEGAATAGPYDLRAGFFGPLDERRLLLSSAGGTGAGGARSGAADARGKIAGRAFVVGYGKDQRVVGLGDGNRDERRCGGAVEFEW